MTLILVLLAVIVLMIGAERRDHAQHHRSAAQAVEVAKKVAEGESTCTSSVTSRDETGQLLAALQRMVA